MSIPTRITAAMRRAGISQAELARRVGVSRTSVGRWLSGEQEPNMSRIRSIAKATGIAPETITGQPKDLPTVVVRIGDNEALRIKTMEPVTVEVIP